MKYVMLEVEQKDAPARRVPVMFPDELVHADMARALERVVKSTWKGAKVTVASAGDVRLDNVICGGKSETLDIASLGRVDSQIIEMYDYLHGIVI